MQNRFKRIGFFFICCFFSFFSLAIFAQTNCSNTGFDNNQNIYFYDTLLGSYNVNFKITLNAIENHGTSPQIPYSEKTWTGSCPGGLTGPSGSCKEYTVYPNDQNFSPSGMMDKIKKLNHNQTDRGAVRILTDKSGTHYAYTTDHEETFCGPYSF